MNKTSLLLAAALASTALTGNAWAFSPKDSTAPAPSKRAPRVIPSSIVQPSGLPRSFVDTVVSVEFTLDRTGQPRDIKVLDVRVTTREDTTLERQLIAAFRQWRFDVTSTDAALKSKRFILPVMLRAEG